MSIARLARPEIRALEPYRAAQQVEDTVRLNANEAPFTNGADHFRRPLNRYPELRPARLRDALAARFGCAPGRLLVTRGTSEAIDLLIRSFCREGRDSIATTSPSFSMYAHYARIQGCAIREATTSRDADFAVDADALCRVCDDDTRLVFLCSPNNPTGTSVPREVLVELLEKRGPRSAIVVDEAYIEFSRQASAIELLDRHDNLIVLRTLSKALAFAGARCGAVIGPAEVITMLSAVQAPYALSTPVVECVEDALADEWLNAAGQSVAATVAERERLAAAVRAFPFVRRIWPSDANFFLAELDDAGAVMSQTRADGVLLRYFGEPLADCVRISVGSRKENDLLLASLSRISAA